ncbi:MAG: peptide ABC transporter substrate-binding protein, partial [Treponema sp.]|nr:peptide ABC transporter substrate-binding protein [Treponema sp.]
MKMKLTALVSAVVMAGLLASCGGKKDTPASGNAGNAQEGAKKGSVLHVQVGPSPETIDPALNSAVDGSNMIIHAFEGLLKFDRDNSIVAGLAEKWEQSGDGLTWTFHLRPGLKWSDGSPLTAEDFVYTWKRVADPNTAAPYGYDLLNLVVGFD